MIKAERHDRIMAELAKRGAVGVQELAELLDTSPATIRRDIAELDGKNAVVRTHGGAVLQDGHQELPYDAKVMTFHLEKRRIGAMAASMLSPGQTVGFGGGTTVMNMITAIKRMQLHVVTTAVNVALELRDAADIDVLLTGGMFRARTAEMVGHVAERTLNDVNLDVAVIGIDGIDIERGLTTYDSAEAVFVLAGSNRREALTGPERRCFHISRPSPARQQKAMPLSLTAYRCPSWKSIDCS
jgi:DeoR/GlpR family transcriptional regulator of sugar metabolism